MPSTSRRRRRDVPEGAAPGGRILSAGRVFGLVLVAAALLAAHRLLWRPARANLLLITVDTLRADHVGAYGYGPASTPTLDGLARRGARFEWAETAVPITGPSHSTILTGLYPPLHGVRDNVTFVLDGSHPTLATLLKGAGYHTGAFVAAFPLAGSLGFSRGFDEFSEGFHEVPGAEGAERPANEVVDSALSWLEKAPEPFFVWIHLYDPHAPYQPPPPFRETFRQRPYDGEIAFADAQLGRVFDALRASGRDARTVVAALGDHGESLGEHGEATHAVLLYESTLRVPLLMAGPGVEAGRVVRDRVGTVDVFPTVLGLLGIDPPAGLSGRDLRPALSGQPLHPEPRYAETLFGRLNCRWATLRSWTEGDWKLVKGSRWELYDLSQDPGEARDRAQDEPGRTSRMLAALEASVARMAPGGDTLRVRAVSPEQLERLRSLGYTGGGTGGGGEVDETSLPDPREKIRVYELLQSLLLSPPGRAAEAADAAASAVDLDPGNPLAFYTLATLAYHAGELSRADRALVRCLALDPDRPAIRAYRAQLLRDMERFEDSERELRLAVEQSPPMDLRTRVSLAETLTASGKREEARTILSAVLARAPNLAEAIGAEGRLLLAEGHGKEAIVYLTRACRAEQPEPWIELANAELILSDAPAAHEAAAHALRLNPGHPFALAVLGHALVLEGHRAEGLLVLRQGVESVPRRPRVWRSLARAFAAAGDTVMAAQCQRAAEANIRG